jgi:hypothetical protein
MEGEVGRFSVPADGRDHNHEHYLAEASQFLRGVTDPLDVLRFLDKLWESRFAKRDAQKRAVDDVGKWLGARLLGQPDLSCEDLAFELGWLRRLVVIRARASQRDERVSVASSRSHGPPVRASNAPAPQSSFRSFIRRIEQKREASHVSAPARSATAPEAPRRVAPDRLPDVVEATFTDIASVRDARKVAREREKKGKAAKVAWLSLTPVDSLLIGLAKGLSCTLTTPGFDALYSDLTRQDGKLRSFFVTDLRGEEGRLVAGRILLQLAKSEVSS